MRMVLCLDDRRMSVEAWGPIVGIEPRVILRRLKHGWSHRRALTEPAGMRAGLPARTYNPTAEDVPIDRQEFRRSASRVVREFERWRRSRGK